MANCISAGKVMEDIRMADTYDSAKVLVDHYTKVTYCGTLQDLCWYLYFHMLDLCVPCLYILSTEDHELGLINVNPQVPNLDLCSSMIQMSIDGV